MTTYLQREIAKRVRDALEDMPVVVVTGMRQCGKTTFLTNDPVVRIRQYYSLDRFSDLEAFRLNAEALLASREPITIDEVQRWPELMVAIKEQVDREGQAPGRFLLSGSANFSLLRGITESLAGRAVYLEMSPMSRREILQSTDREPFLRHFFESPALPHVRGSFRRLTEDEVLRGGMPRVASRTVKQPAIWFSGYEQTYVERDVRQLTQVGDLVAFRRAVRLAALRTAKVLKLSELARDAQLPVSTLTRYLGVMETSCLVWRLPPFLANPASRLMKSPKLYFADAGLAAHLAGVTSILPASSSLFRGAIIETYVAQNLLGILSTRWPGASLAYWNVQGRHEVDFVISVGADCLAIEVKSASRWQESDLAGLRAFLEFTPRCRAGVLAYSGVSPAAIGERLFAVPLELLLS